MRSIKTPNLISLLLFILIASGCSESNKDSINDNAIEKNGASMWIDYLNTFIQEYRFNPPANENEVAQISEKLSVMCPEELSQLLLETNGIDDEWGSPLIYSTLQIVDRNIEERTSEDNKEMGLSYDDMLLFSDAGNGDYFGYIIKNGIVQDGIYIETLLTRRQPANDRLPLLRSLRE